MRTLLAFLVLLLAGGASAQSTESAVSEVAPATSTQPTEIKRFDQKKWREIVGDEDFSESERKRKSSVSKDSLSQEDWSTRKRLKSDESDEEDPEISTTIPIPPIILKIIFYGVTIGIIGYILFLILKDTSFKWNRKIVKTEATDSLLTVTDIKELEIDRLLREAIASGNYRLAIRISFLGLLKRLDEGGLIVWKKDKTNRDYLFELFSQEMYFEEVKKLTLSYEQVWYGDHTLSVQSYEEIIASFRAIDEKLNASLAQ